jgi:hypothetical protein
VCFEVFWRHFLINRIYNIQNVANICHLMLETGLYTKQLHFIYKFNNVISTWYIFNLGVGKILYRSQIPRNRNGTDGATALGKGISSVFDCSSINIVWDTYKSLKTGMFWLIICEI